MLAFRKNDEQPLVLLPGLTRRYRVVDPSTGETMRADSRTAGLRDLFVAGSAGAARDLAVLALTGIAAGALSLAPALAVHLLVGRVAPGGGGGGCGGRY